MKCIKIFLILLALTAFFTGCAMTTSPAATDVPAQITQPVEETTAPTTAETEAVLPPLSDIWSIVDSEGVEEIPILPGLEKDDIDAWAENTPFTEIKLYQRTCDVRLGTYGDVVVAQMSMAGEKDWISDGIIWNVRMEKADGLENRTGIEIPENAVQEDSIETFNTKNWEIPVRYYSWATEGSLDDTSKPVHLTEIHLVYFENSRNLYTIYSDDLVGIWNGSQWEWDQERWPTAVFNNIKGDGNRYGRNLEQITDQRGQLRYFRLKMGEELVTYQYEMGMSLINWVNSQYNVDGWKVNPADSSSILSSDEKWMVADAESHIWRLHLALPRN